MKEKVPTCVKLKRWGKGASKPVVNVDKYPPGAYIFAGRIYYVHTVSGSQKWWWIGILVKCGFYPLASGRLIRYEPVFGFE